MLQSLKYPLTFICEYANINGMKKTLSISILTTTLFFVFLFIPPQIFAQNTDSGLRFSCLEAVSCVQQNSNCTVKSIHRARLSPSASAKAVPNDINTYVTECLDVDSDNNGIPETMCTTGNSTLDKELFCDDANSTDPLCDHYTLMKDRLGYSIDKAGGYGIYFVSNNQANKQATATRIASDGVGNIVPPIIEWQSYSNRNTVHRYLIWNKIKFSSKDPGGLGVQQQSDLEFAFRSSTCGGISWDPYGRLFDTKSLEPIPSGQATLKQLDKTTNSFSEAFASQSNPNIINPFPILSANGLFTFIVVDGTYTLHPVSTGYRQSNATKEALDASAPNMARAYTNYYTTISEPVVQQGAIQKRDIPMEPVSGVGNKYPLKVISQTEEVLNNGNIKFYGSVSHPLTRLVIKICGVETGAEKCDTGTVYTANNGGPNSEGKFSVELNQKLLQPGQYFKPAYEFVDLTKETISFRNKIQNLISRITNTLFPEVNAQDNTRTVSTTIQPIISYIEGYAYDAQGSLLPNSNVGIYVSFSERPVYTTKTNAQGYYKITSEYLPKTAYTLRYTSTKGPAVQTVLTTSQFLIQNREFIESEKVNPYLITTQTSDPRRTVTPAFTPNQQTSPIPNLTQIVVQPTTNPDVDVNMPVNGSPEKNNTLLYVGILLILVSLAGGAAIYYIMKKKV